MSNAPSSSDRAHSGNSDSPQGNEIEQAVGCDPISIVANSRQNIEIGQLTPSNKDLPMANELRTALTITGEAAPGYFEQILKRISDRAKALKAANRWILASIIGLLVIGSLAFWWSDFIAGEGPVGKLLEQAVQAQTIAQTRVDELKRNASKVVIELSRIKQSNENCLYPLNSLAKECNAISQKHKDKKSFSELERVDLLADLEVLAKPSLLDASEAVLSAITEDTNEVQVPRDAKKVITVKRSVLERTEEFIKSAGLAVGDVAGYVKIIRASVTNIKEYPGKEPAEIQSLVVATSNIKDKINAVYSLALQEQNKLENEVNGTSSSRESADELLAAERQLREAGENLSELRTTQASSAGLAWVPSLAVRIAVVIILLFLTQFLIALYRYNLLMIDAFDVRATAIHLAPKANDGLSLDLPQMKLAAEILAISKIDFVTPEPVTKHILSAFGKSGG